MDVNDITLGGGVINGTGSISIIGNISASGTLATNVANLGSLNVAGSSSFSGTVRAGEIEGDLKGSVFADDSTPIVDAIDLNISVRKLFSLDNDLQILNNGSTDENQIDVIANENRSIFNLTRQSASDLTGNTTGQYGAISFSRVDVNGALTTGIIFGREDSIYIGQDRGGDFSTANKYVVWKNQKLGIGVTSPAVELDVVGDASVSGLLEAGSLAFSGTTIDTIDSSAINVVPGVTFNSDVTVENNLVVTNTLTVDTLEVTNFQTAGSGTPELASDTDILLTAGTRVEITQSPLKMASFTTTERNALTPQNGDVIYNTTDSKFQGYAGGAWVNLH